jgi:hypothetical protein
MVIVGVVIWTVLACHWLAFSTAAGFRHVAVSRMALVGKVDDGGGV